MKQKILDAISRARRGVTNRAGELPTDTLLAEVLSTHADDEAFSAVIDIFEAMPNEDADFWRFLRAFYERLRTRDRGFFRRLLAVVQRPQFSVPLAVGQVMRFLAQRGFSVSSRELSVQTHVLNEAPLVYADIAILIGARDEFLKGIRRAIEAGRVNDIPVRLTNWCRRQAEWFPQALEDAISICRSNGINPASLEAARKTLIGSQNAAPPRPSAPKPRTEELVKRKALTIFAGQEGRRLFVPIHLGALA